MYVLWHDQKNVLWSRVSPRRLNFRIKSHAATTVLFSETVFCVCACVCRDVEFYRDWMVPKASCCAEQPVVVVAVDAARVEAEK